MAERISDERLNVLIAALETAIKTDREIGVPELATQGIIVTHSLYCELKAARAELQQKDEAGRELANAANEFRDEHGQCCKMIILPKTHKRCTCGVGEIQEAFKNPIIASWLEAKGE